MLLSVCALYSATLLLVDALTSTRHKTRYVVEIGTTWVKNILNAALPDEVIKNAETYNQLLKDTDVITPYVEPYNYHIYNQYIIRVDKRACHRAKRRDELQEFLNERKIGTAIYYPVSLHLQGCYADLGYKEGDFPESEKAAKETLALPIYSEMTEEQQMVVVEVIRELMEKSTHYFEVIKNG